MVQTRSQAPSFTPSERLIDMFASGARDYLRRAQRSDDEETRELFAGSADQVLDLTPSRVGNIIGSTLRNVLISLGGRRQMGLLKTEIVAREEFTKVAEEEILESLPIDDVHGHEFCQILLSELKNYLKDGGKIAGNWGHVGLTEKSEVAVIVTTPPRRRPKPSHLRTRHKTINF